MNIKCPKCGVEYDPDQLTAHTCPMETYKQMAEEWNKSHPAPSGPTGWICPRCGRGHSPWTQSCPCVYSQPYYPTPYYPPHYPWGDPWWGPYTIC